MRRIPVSKYHYKASLLLLNELADKSGTALADTTNRHPVCKTSA